MTESNETPNARDPDEPRETPAEDPDARPQNGGNDRQSKEGASPAPDESQRDTRPRIYARYGLLGQVGEFTMTKKVKLQRDSKVVLQTERGIEIGERLPIDLGDDQGLHVDQDLLAKYFDASGPDYLQRRAGRVLREATAQDLDEERHINADVTAEMTFCQSLIDKYQLPMKLITCEHIFGGERIIFYFMADGRVDFRQIVRDLAREYQTRIEMRQVGARDEARLVADYEICGRECCCKNFLKTLRPVSMKMAKIQKATLDPSKVSGRCGRLRCCLRYEQQVYTELNKRLPRNNTWVRTVEGEGKIVDRQVITQLLTVELEGGRRVTFPLEEVEVLGSRPEQPVEAQEEASKEKPDRRSDRDAEEKPKRRSRRGRRRPSDREDSGGKPKPEKRRDEKAPESQNAESRTAPETPPKEERPPTEEGSQKKDDHSKPGDKQPKGKGEQKSGKKRRRRRRRPRKGGGGSGKKPNGGGQ